MMKVYDEHYFRRWYHDESTRVNSTADVRRKVNLAVAQTEYFLRRKIRSVLDVGCGEGVWRGHLKSMRPAVRYLGLDSSEYAVRKFGKSRNIRRASFGDLPKLDLGVFDLVVCSDVLHYVPDQELKQGVVALAEMTDGVAFLEVLTREDEIVGDLHGMIRRPAAWYRRIFRNVGLTAIGPYCWLSPAFRDSVAELETS